MNIRIPTLTETCKVPHNMFYEIAKMSKIRREDFGMFIIESELRFSHHENFNKDRERYYKRTIETITWINKNQKLFNTDEYKYKYKLLKGYYKDDVYISGLIGKPLKYLKIKKPK